MPRHKKDTLVALTVAALDRRSEWYEYNISCVRNYGYLWLVNEWRETDDFYKCRSLATGTVKNFKAYEITTSKRLMAQPMERNDG